MIPCDYISDFLPFLIEVHEFGHVVAQSHRRHSTGRVRISIEKNDKMSRVKGRWPLLLNTGTKMKTKIQLQKIWREKINRLT